MFPDSKICTKEKAAYKIQIHLATVNRSWTMKQLGKCEVGKTFPVGEQQLTTMYGECTQDGYFVFRWRNSNFYDYARFYSNQSRICLVVAMILTQDPATLFVSDRRGDVEFFLLWSRTKSRHHSFALKVIGL